MRLILLLLSTLRSVFRSRSALDCRGNFLDLVHGRPHAEAIRLAVREKKTILVVASTGSRKTTLVNAILDASRVLLGGTALSPSRTPWNCSARSRTMWTSER
jgi:hypothetical protein